jgi:hypothetical protein
MVTQYSLENYIIFCEILNMKKHSPKKLKELNIADKYNKVHSRTHNEKT